MPASAANCRPRAVGIAGDDEADLDRQRARVDLLDQIAQRRAAAGDEDGDGQALAELSRGWHRLTADRHPLP